MKIGKSFTFETAHRLLDHDGKCARLHGHSYRVEVIVEGLDDLQPEGPARGMIVDFDDIKPWIQGIQTDFDHYALLERGDPIADALQAIDEPVRVVEYRPTAENIAKRLKYDLSLYLQEFKADDGPMGLSPWTSIVRVWETATSYAEA